MVKQPATPPDLRELAQDFDQQGYVLKRVSHRGGELLATGNGEARRLDDMGEARRFIKSIEGKHHE